MTDVGGITLAVRPRRLLTDIVLKSLIYFLVRNKFILLYIYPGICQIKYVFRVDFDDFQFLCLSYFPIINLLFSHI